MPSIMSQKLKPNKQIVFRRKSPRLQAGFALETMALALLIAALAATLAFRASNQADMATLAVTQADGLKNVANAAETLVMEHYDSY